MPFGGSMEERDATWCSGDPGYGRNRHRARHSRYAKGEDEAVEKAKASELVRDPSVTRSAVRGEVLQEHPEAKGTCDVCGGELLGGE